ncbi:restriction endonuclease subunit S [Streptomyces sp. NPDC057052]|uniref:restriction endonuclease subunit S n=1 Tax=Streptomyces sp. NPDC057052 TaxID=3346010 RepID=UPI00363C63E6
MRSQIEGRVRTTAGIYKVNQAILEAVSLPLPPLAEQDRIVEALDEQLSRLDRVESVASRVRCRKSHLAGAFRDSLICAKGELLAGWRWGELRDVIELVEAGKSFRCDPRPARDEEWGVIKVSAMTWGEFRQEEQKAVPVGREVDARYEIKVGDILVSRANTPEHVGAPVLVRRTRARLLLSDKSLRLVPKLGVNRDWLITALSSPLVRRQITAKATGSKDSMRNISQKDLLSVKIPLPPEDEQQSLAERADELLTAIDGAAREVERVGDRAGALRRLILRRAFSGQLVAQNSADEQASVALVRVVAERAAQSAATRTRKTMAKKAAVPRVATPMGPAPEPTSAPALAVQQEFDL